MLEKKITNTLIKLCDKALLGLSGLIGAVVTFILKSAERFVAKNLWTLIVAVGGLLYYELTVKTSNTNSKKTHQ